jgi:hypothetical protein
VCVFQETNVLTLTGERRLVPERDPSRHPDRLQHAERQRTPSTNAPEPEQNLARSVDWRDRQVEESTTGRWFVNVTWRRYRRRLWG